MNERSSASLVSRLRKLVVAIVLTTSVAIGWLGYSTAESVAREEARQWLGDAVAVYDSLLAEFLEDFQSAVTAVAGNRGIQDLVERHLAGGISREALHQQCRSGLLDHVNDTAGVVAIILTDRDGKVLTASDDRHLARSFGDHPDFRKGLLEPHVSEPILSGKKYHAFAAGPLRSSRGDVLGVIIAMFDWTALVRVITSPQRLGATGEVVVGSRRGEVVNIIVPGDGSETIRIPLSMESVTGRAVLGQRGFVETVDYRGREVLAAFRPAGKSHWGLVVKITTAEAFQNVRRLRWILAGSTLLLVVLAMGVTHILARRIAQPILRLAHQAARIAQGDLGARAQVGAPDEIGALARHFNLMAENLAASQANLEQKVELRTRELQRAHHLLESILNCMGDAVVVVDHQGALILHNPEARRILGVSSGSTPGTNWARAVGAHLPDRVTLCPEAEFPLTRALGGQHVLPTEMLLSNPCVPGGLWVSMVARPLLGPGDAPQGGVLVVHDVSEQKAAAEAVRKSHEQLRIAAKMEAVGTLAAGVAHHFSNLVQVIIGHAEAFETLIGPGHSHRRALDTIFRTADRASELVRQLLRYARRDAREARLVDMNTAVQETLEMLRSFVPRSIRFASESAPAMAGVRADPRELEEMLVNLVINARDAMPDGGEIGITTAVDAAPDGTGRVLIRVRDTGCGMDDETRTRIFEPFYTTKGPDHGTGLGLALVYGIVQRSGGTIDVQSEVGKGTVVAIRFPLARGDVALTSTLLPDDSDREEPHALDGDETLLVVESHEELRDVLVQRLTDRGYTALEAGCGEDAVAIVRDWADPLHLIITDIALPDLSGAELVSRLRAIRPDVPVLHMVGQRHDPARAGAPVGESMSKPFRIAALLRRLRALLDAKARDRHGL